VATREWKRKIHERDCHKCQICGSTYKLTIHHKRAVARGGQSTPENTVCWCTECHHLYHKKWGITTSDNYGNPIEPRFTGRKKKHRRKNKHH